MSNRTNSNDPRPNAKGFTLIEVMTALTVMAIAFVILLGLRNRDVALSAKASHLIQATLLAQQKISELSLEKDKDTGNRKGDFGETFAGYRWEMEIHETSRLRIRELVLSVFWKSSTREENIRLTRYLMVKG